MPAGELDPGCIFCKIVRGEIPSQRVFDSEHVFAFLDINPLAPGHTVVIPRHHAEFLHDLPEDWAAQIGRSLGRIGQAVVKAANAEGYNVLQNNGAVSGQVVPHVHFHVIPRRALDGLGYRWNAKSAAPEELAALAELIRAAL